MRLIFYTTPGCHLCEQAEAMLDYLRAQPGLAIEKVDVASSESLVERYGERIPVVAVEEDSSGKPRRELDWPFEFADLLALSG